MCHSPPCPDGCRIIGKTGHARKQRMFRAYVRLRDERMNLRAVPVGWWCPACHSFTADLP